MSKPFTRVYNKDIFNSVRKMKVEKPRCFGYYKDESEECEDCAVGKECLDCTVDEEAEPE